MTQPAFRRSVTTVLTIGGLIGLLVRAPMLFFMGMGDMNVYYEWGKSALESSLPSTYHGIYFPLQYQVLEACFWIASKSGWDFVPVLKLANLVFDIGSFGLLVLLLKRQGSNPAYALLYWLHPWFLSVFALGYVDFQFTFFVLFSIYLLRGETARDYILAGLPLAVAFLMKPQAQILLICCFLYGVVTYVRTRNARPLGLMAFPILLFLGYEAYFTISLFPAAGYDAVRKIPSTYLNVTNVMPALNAQMPNLWYPVAFFMKQPGDRIFATSDQIQLLPGISAKYLAAAVTLALVGLHVYRVARQVELPVRDRFVSMFGFASVAVPFLMTSAHENHLFLGSAFLVLFTAAWAPLAPRVATHILLLMQFLNIYGLYGRHPSWLGQLLRDAYEVRYVPVVYSLISIACFVVILPSIWRAHNRASSSLRPGTQKHLLAERFPGRREVQTDEQR